MPRTEQDKQRLQHGSGLGGPLREPFSAPEQFAIHDANDHSKGSSHRRAAHRAGSRLGQQESEHESKHNFTSPAARAASGQSLPPGLRAAFAPLIAVIRRTARKKIENRHLKARAENEPRHHRRVDLGSNAAKPLLASKVCARASEDRCGPIWRSCILRRVSANSF
jgi:hypothetical protein